MNAQDHSTPFRFITASIFAILLSGCLSLWAQSLPAASTRPQQGGKSQSARVSAVDDWSSHTVVFSNPSALEKSNRPGDRERFSKIVNDPRYVMQRLKRRQPVSEAARSALADLEARTTAANRSGENFGASGRMTGELSAATDITRVHSRTPLKQPMERDWSMSLSAAGVASDMFPAIFTYDANSNPDCRLDFVAFGVDTDGAPGQASIIGFNNLYVNSSGTGYCPGTAPSILFSYYVNTGVVVTSPTVSTDGTQIAFIDSIASGSQFHVLKVGTTGNNGTSATAPAFPGEGNNAVDTSVVLSGSPW